MHRVVVVKRSKDKSEEAMKKSVKAAKGTPSKKATANDINEAIKQHAANKAARKSTPLGKFKPSDPKDLAVGGKFNKGKDAGKVSPMVARLKADAELLPAGKSLPKVAPKPAPKAEPKPAAEPKKRPTEPTPPAVHHSAMPTLAEIKATFLKQGANVENADDADTMLSLIVAEQLTKIAETMAAIIGVLSAPAGKMKVGKAHNGKQLTVTKK